MHYQIKLQSSKPRHKTTEHLLAGSLVSALLWFSGIAYAEPESSEASLYSIRDLPLLADYRFDDRDPHSRDAYDPRKHREPSRPRQDDRDRRDPKHRVYKTESRERYHPPRHHRVEPPVIVQPRYRHPWRPHHPRERILVRPFRYVYPHHRPHYHDGHIWGLLSFTAITLAILDNLNDQQQREHERALYDATSTPLGETIYWKEGDASGAVTPTREGTSSSGRYCREYQSEVSIGGNMESIYGTACRNADGSWEIEQ